MACEILTFASNVPECPTFLDPYRGTLEVSRVAIAPEVGRNAGSPLFCAAGNPVNHATGNKFEIETDYAGAGPFPLRFSRFYNSRSTGITSRIAAWTHSYTQTLHYRVESGAEIAVLNRPEGNVYALQLVAGEWRPDSNVNIKLTKLPNNAGWNAVTEDDETEVYDASGKLTAVRNRQGLTQTITYDASPYRITRVDDPFGRALLFGYNSQNRVTSITLPGGSVIQYAYPESTPVLQSVTHADGKTRSYVYNEPAFVENLAPGEHLLTGIVDENNQRFANFGYGLSLGARRATLTEHAGSAGRTTVSYSSGASTVTDASNASRTFSFQPTSGALNVASIGGPPGPQCGPLSQGFDANGNVSSQTDWNNNQSSFTYDLARNLETSRVEAAGTPQARTISTQYHPSFRLPTGVAEPLRITSYTYDTNGNLLTKSVQATTDANGSQGFSATSSGAPRIWTYSYNANGQVLTANGPRTDVSDVTTYSYHANNDADINKRANLATVTNAAGHITQITSYNAHGQPLTIVDPNSLTTTLTYDARQRLKTRNVGGETTTYDYDNAGQLIKVTLPDGSFLSYSYDAAHRLTGIQDSLGNKITYTLDLAGNRTKEEVFDPGNILVQTRSRVFSNINRLFQELGAANQTTEYTYDNQGNVKTIKDPLNKTTTNDYDPLNRLKQVIDPANGVTLYGYNGLDALTQVTDPRSLVTGYTVNGLGNLTQQVSPDTGQTTNTYDSGGNLATQTDAKLQTTIYTYDALNRVTLVTFHDSSKQAYAYDQGANGLGRLSSITETNPSNVVTSQIAYAYSQHGRVTSETRTVNGVAYTLGYSYDSSGRLSGLTYPSGRAISYTFDALGRVSQVSTTKNSQTQVVVQNVQYHPFGGAKSWTLGNGQAYSRTIDQDGRIASYTLGGASYAIGFDAASRITGIGANIYGYDALDRLTSAVLPSSNYAFGYDAVGNRLTKTTGANTDTYTYSATSNRIATLTPFGSSQRTFVFDANGSTTNDGVNTYAYDTRGRMSSATTTAGTTTYQVNALGQRIAKTNASGETVFHYDNQGRLIAESTPSGTIHTEWIYLGDIPLVLFR